MTIMLKKLVQNEYTELRKENELRKSPLNKRNQDILRQVYDRMSAYTWNCYEVELVRKDLIGMAAQAEARGSDLEQVMGGNPDEYCRQIVEGIDRGSPLDYVCTWYPVSYMIFVGFNVVMLIVNRGNAQVNLLRTLASPFLFLFWLCICAWMHRIGHRLNLRFGVWVELGWNILLIAVFAVQCYIINELLSVCPIQMPLWLVILYELALAAASQYWQNFRYNRYARNHPWREQTQQQEENRYGIQ